MLLAIAAVVAALVYYEHRHPCLRYSTRRVFVPELTIYTEINGGTANAANGGMSIPVTTPAHYEDDLVCEERK
jgi:hypothetical protein